MKKNKFLLTLSIPTYNRADKLERLLGIIDDGSNFISNDVNVYVSNNASTDNTKEVLQKYKIIFKNKGINFSYVNHVKSIGMGGNFINVYTEPRSDYIWWCSDDDIIFTELIPELLGILKVNRPSVLNMGFLQPPYTIENPRYQTEDFGFYQDKESIVKMISTKLTAFIVRRKTKLNIDYEFIKKSYWSHVYIALDLIFSDGGYFIYSKNIARCDDQYLDIRYPPDALFELKEVLHNMYSKYDINDSQINLFNKLDTVLVNLQFLKLHYTKEAVLDSKIINLIKIKLFKLLFFQFQILRPKYFRGVLSFFYHILKRFLCKK